MKYETINNQLCRMVEPEPLHPDSKMPCMVTRIEDGEIGRYTKWHISGLIGEKLVATSIVDGNVVFTDKTWNICNLPYLYFEIIGYPVVDGSAEWALQMMKLGNKVRNSDWDDGTYEKSLLYCQLIGETIKHNEGCSAFDVCLSDWEAPYIKNTGWQIYEPEPDTQYKVGGWVEYETCGGNLIHGQIASINSVNVNIISQRHGLCRSNIWLAIDGTSDVYGYRLIRKLAPSEVIVHIGCLEGTVAPGCSDTTIMIVPIGYNGIGDVAIIPVAMLDPDTAALVRELLAAQEEK